MYKRLSMFPNRFPNMFPKITKQTATARLFHPYTIPSSDATNLQLFQKKYPALSIKTKELFINFSKLVKEVTPNTELPKHDLESLEFKTACLEMLKTFKSEDGINHKLQLKTWSILTFEQIKYFCIDQLSHALLFEERNEVEVNRNILVLKQKIQHTNNLLELQNLWTNEATLIIKNALKSIPSTSLLNFIIFNDLHPSMLDLLEFTCCHNYYAFAHHSHYALINSNNFLSLQEKMYYFATNLHSSEFFKEHPEMFDLSIIEQLCKNIKEARDIQDLRDALTNSEMEFVCWKSTKYTLETSINKDISQEIINPAFSNTDLKVYRA